MAGFSVRLLLQSNTDDFPRLLVMMGSGLRKNHRCHPTKLETNSKYEGLKRRIMAGFSVRLLLQSNTDDFPRLLVMMGSGLRKNHRCHPTKLETNSEYEGSKRRIMAGFSVRLLLQSNTDDFPRLLVMMGSGLRKNRRCHPTAVLPDAVILPASF